jgi:hypothetical protein
MASEKNEGTGTIHRKALHHQNFIICRFSTIFLRHPEKTSSFIEKEEKHFFGDSLYSTPDLILNFNLLVPSPSGPSSMDNVSWKTKFSIKVSL